MSARRELRRKQRATRPAAYEDAYDLCSTVGPEAVAEAYDLDGSPRQIARGYARIAYHGPARHAAARGARAGFADWAAARDG